jgi:hypothetical protein
LISMTTPTKKTRVGDRLDWLLESTSEQRGRRDI